MRNEYILKSENPSKIDGVEIRFTAITQTKLGDIVLIQSTKGIVEGVVISLSLLSLQILLPDETTRRCCWKNFIMIKTPQNVKNVAPSHI